MKTDDLLLNCRLAGAILALCALLVIDIAGCAPKPEGPPPRPTIQVTRNGDIANDGIVINFKNHVKWKDVGNNQREFYAEVKLKNLEDIREYKKEIKYLLQQLDEAEAQLYTPAEKSEAEKVHELGKILDEK